MKKKTTFIELRAKGLSYDRISIEIDVSKPTLIKWSQDFKDDIKNLQSLEIDSLRNQFKTNKIERSKYIYSLFEKLREELSKRDLSTVPTQKLIELNLKALESLDKEKLELSVVAPFDVPDFRMEKIKFDT